MRKTVSFLLMLLSAIAAKADIKLPQVFSDHMVLQRNKPIHVWGWASSGEAVKVALGTASQSTRANKQGKWEVFLPAMPAGGPHVLTVTGKNSVQLNDVMIGEVWLCGGQSNMEWPVRLSINPEKEIAAANYPMIRHIKIQRATALQKQDDVQETQWEVCSPATAANFTAVGYFYARELFKELNVPIGLINSNWGGTMVETWISNESFFGDAEFASLKKDMPASFDSIIKIQELAMQNLVKNAQGLLPTIAEARTFSKADYNDADWKTMKVPGAWENAGLPNLDGTVWFRKEIEIPAGTDLNNAILVLGPIDDADSTYINGILVGTTNVYNVQRSYNVGAGILKEGKNIIAVRVFDSGGGGGMYGQPQQMKLQTQGVTIPVAGNWKYRIEKHQVVSGVGPNDYPTLLYNAMIHPLIGYPIAGAIWYQGESNTGRSMQYKKSFPLMIKDWRKQWKNEFPFYFVQLANFNANNASNATGGSGWAELREAQAETLQLPNTGMAVTIDIGESGDIHPRNKQDVGKRLAAVALAKTYGKDRVFSGPTYKSMQIDGGSIVLTFENVGDGWDIKNKYGYIHGFEIAGEDQKFHYAKALLRGNEIIVFSGKVALPVAVRFAWADDPNDVNLYNKAGFPAVPFRTDNWKGITEVIKYRIR
jgi:sialate O-acetylesterase